MARGNVEVCDKLGSSDHRMVSFEIDAGSKNNQGFIMKLGFRRADFQLLRELASHADPTFPEDAGANVCFNIFKEWLETLCDRCIPKRRVRRRHQSTKPLWWTPEVGRVIEERQAAYCRSKRHQTEVNVMTHVNACRAVKRILRRAKLNKEEQVALDAKRNPKALYCYIYDWRVGHESIGPLVDSGGNLVSDGAGMATLINNHFASVFTVENTDELPRLDAAQADAADHAGATLDTVQFTSAIVKEKLGELEVPSLVSPDNMHHRVLKELKVCLSASLADIFTRSMATVEVPDEWKIDNLTGIYKKGWREISGNYRPIS